MQDHEIIELYWQRDEEAIRETDRKYGAYCRRVAMNVLGNAQDADECANDTWLKTWNLIPENRPAFLQGFLAKLTRRGAIDRLRRGSAKKRGAGETYLALEELGECVSGTDSVEEAFDAKQLAQAIDRFLDGLKEQERVIFVRRYFYVESVQSIADGLQLRANHVSVILSRTRNRLKSFLLEEGFEV